MPPRLLAVNDFDCSLLPSDARQPGTGAFTEEVTRYFRHEYADFGGFVRVVVGEDAIEVTWTPDPTRPEPMDIVLRHLNRGEYPEGIRLMNALMRYRPADIRVLYNLGLALSETGNAPRAEELLRRAVEINPDDSNTRVGLGVALARQQKTAEAVDVLREVVSENPSNPWARW
ncbi:MAG: tetratricopeptide repeat protein [Planctomycetota bacterium]